MGDFPGSCCFWSSEDEEPFVVLMFGRENLKDDSFCIVSKRDSRSLKAEIEALLTDDVRKGVGGTPIRVTSYVMEMEIDGLVVKLPTMSVRADFKRMLSSGLSRAESESALSSLEACVWDGLSQGKVKLPSQGSSQNSMLRQGLVDLGRSCVERWALEKKSGVRKGESPVRRQGV